MQTCVRLRPGESFLALVDHPLADAGGALCASAQAMGAASVQSFTLPEVSRPQVRADGPAAPARPLTVVPDRLLRLIRQSDVIVSLLADLDLTVEVPALRAAVSAFRAARRGRWAFGAYIDQDVLTNELTADYREVARVAGNLAARLEGVDQVRLRTAAGTDLTLRLGRRPVHVDTGILTEPGDFGNLPAGEAFVAPLEESAEGSLVVDLSLGDLILAEPVTLTFQAGRVISVTGGEAAQRLHNRLGADPWAWTLGEFGLGANPHARIRGRVTTDEKVLGTAHIALGANTSFGGCNPAATHYDCVIGAPQIYLDGHLLSR